jgi:hypothetical protein
MFRQLLLVKLALCLAFERILHRSKHLDLQVLGLLLLSALSLNRSQRYPRRVKARAERSFIFESIGFISILASICYKQCG